MEVMLFASSLTGSNTKRVITRDLECSCHDYCIICSYDVTGADFKIPCALSANQKRVREFNVYCYIARLSLDKMITVIG